MSKPSFRYSHKQIGYRHGNNYKPVRIPFELFCDFICQARCSKTKACADPYGLDGSTRRQCVNPNRSCYYSADLRSSNCEVEFISARSATVRSFSTLPVLSVDFGSNKIISHSSALNGQCSTPRGIIINSPAETFSSRSSGSRIFIVRTPLVTRNNSSSCSWWCQTKSPWTFTNLRCISLISPHIFGDHWSLNWANPAFRLKTSGTVRAVFENARCCHLGGSTRATARRKTILHLDKVLWVYISVITIYIGENAWWWHWNSVEGCVQWAMQLLIIDVKGTLACEGSKPLFWVAKAPPKTLAHR